MTKEEKEKYNKKIKLYEKLGAEKFQKIVFAVERAKYKVIKKCFPNFLKFYDKQCDKQEKRLIKKAKTEEEVRKIKRNTKFSKMAIRKEINQGKNRNYHMDPNRPTEIYKYLEWNKEVHKRGLAVNAVILAVAAVAVACGLTVAIPVIVAEVISEAINLECINIQNCSICKYKRCQEVLEKKEQKKVSYNIDTYGEVAEVIDKAIESSERIPSLSEIISQIEDPEQLIQLRKLVMEELKSRNNQKIKQRTNQKIRGNK